GVPRSSQTDATARADDRGERHAAIVPRSTSRAERRCYSCASGHLPIVRGLTRDTYLALHRRADAARSRQRHAVAGRNSQEPTEFGSEPITRITQMRCNDFLPWLETGNWLQQARARRHAETCPSCAAAEQMLGRVKQDLRSPTKLPPRLRQKWLATVIEQTKVDLASRSPKASARTWYLAAALAAGVLLVLIPLSKWWSNPE